MSQSEMAAFFRGQHFYAVAAGEYLAKPHDFAGVRHIMDVAAARGGVAIGACQSCSDLTATVVDLAGVIPVTRQFLNESAVGGRVTTAIVDVVAGSPEGTYDVAVIRNLVQVLSLEDAQAAVRNVAQSLNPGG